LVFTGEAAKDGADLMPTETAQQILVVFELALFLSGLGFFAWLMASPAARPRWLATNALPPPPFSTGDFFLIATTVFLFGTTFQGTAQVLLGPRIAESPDHQGLSLVIYSVASYAGALLAWKFLFPSLRRTWLADPSVPPVAARPPALPWSRALRYGAGTLLVVLPLLSLTNLGWSYVIDVLDLPAVPQDVIAMFANTRSPIVIAGMLLVACVLAPVYEELLFRAGLYRFCRQNHLGIPMVIALPFVGAAAYIAQVATTKPGLPSDWQLWLMAAGSFVLGVVLFSLTRDRPLIQRHNRGFALVLSGVYFGALHGNVAGFLPLSLLGMGLALAYEASGSIRVAIVAHALFNLNTVLILLSGLPEAVK
jgi:membrane protease YdiL (CAAX protease family)